MANNKDELFELMKVNDQDILNIARASIGQRENAICHQMRFGPITAGNFASVISAIQPNKYNNFIFSSTCFRYTSLYSTLLGAVIT